MKTKLIAAVAALMIATPTCAQVVAVGRVPLVGGAAVYELFQEPAALPECQGLGASGAIVMLESPRGTIGYGTGCWVARSDGNIRILVKSFQDGLVRPIVLHNSIFSAPALAEPASSVKTMIRRADKLNGQCRGGSGDDPKTMAACDERDRLMEHVRGQGWCWGPDDAIGADKRWVRCS